MILCRIALVLSFLLLSGCYTVPSQRTGSSIEVIPVTHQLSLRSEPQYMDGSKRQLDSFFSESKEMFLTRRISLITSSDSGVRLADFAEKQLLSMGVAAENILRNSNHDDRFGFTIQLVEYKVATDLVCENFENNHYYLSDAGCRVEEARWKSIISPERMLNTSTHLSNTWE